MCFYPSIHLSNYKHKRPKQFYRLLFFSSVKIKCIVSPLAQILCIYKYVQASAKPAFWNQQHRELKQNLSSQNKELLRSVQTRWNLSINNQSVFFFSKKQNKKVYFCVVRVWFFPLIPIFVFLFLDTRVTAIIILRNRAGNEPLLVVVMTTF